MNINPTDHQRSVLLSIQFANSGTAQPGSRPTETPRTLCISALFADQESIDVEIFDDRDEPALLRRFWLSLRPNDQIFAANAAEALSLLRHRSWLLDVIPAPQVDLRCVYSVEIWDTGQMWTTGYVPRHLYMEERMEEQPDDLNTPLDDASDFEVHSRD